MPACGHASRAASIPAGPAPAGIRADDDSDAGRRARARVDADDDTDTRRGARSRPARDSRFPDAFSWGTREGTPMNTASIVGIFANMSPEQARDLIAYHVSRGSDATAAALRYEARATGIHLGDEPERKSTMPTKRPIAKMTITEAAAVADDADESDKRRAEAREHVRALLDDDDEEDEDEPEEPKRGAKPEKKAPPPSKEEQARSYEEATRRHEARALASIPGYQREALARMRSSVDAPSSGLTLASGDLDAARRHLATLGAR